MLAKAGLSRLTPTWKGDRGDLVSIGGKKSKNSANWRDSKRDIFDSDKKKIAAMVIEVLVNLVMTTHVYTFGGKVFLQRDGGPIGLRSTASLAALVMKIWDRAWVQLCRNESLELHDYFRYVNDFRNCLQVLREGWRDLHLTSEGE